jgi:hypothetical protein
MADFRVVWEFATPTSATWSEVYYWSGTNVGAAAKLTPTLLAYRLALLDRQNRFMRSRASDVTNNRITAVQVINRVGTAFSLDGPDTPGNTVYVGLSSGQGASRKLAMRGCPDSFILLSVFTGQATPPPELSIGLKSFLSKLAADEYGIRKLAPAGAFPANNVLIQSVDGTITPGQATITIQGVNPLVIGGRCVIGGASKKDLPGLNGHWQVLNGTSSTIVIPYQTPNGIKVTGGAAKVRNESYSGVQPFDPKLCGFAYYGTRKTRNPFSRSRGAQRAARLRHSL